jgi:hypothetical protein
MKTQREFMEGFDELVKLVANARERDREHQAQWLNLVEFLVVFRNLLSKDFFSDEMATTLLREVFFETETADQKEVDDILGKGIENADT